MGAGRVAFDADAEELGLDRVEVPLFGNIRREDFVERLHEPLARCHAVGRRVLVTVGDPDVVDDRVAELLADGGADFPAGDTMGDPELAHGWIRVRESEPIRRERVAEAGGIKIDAPLALCGPVNPRGEVGNSERVAVGERQPVAGVAGVQVQPQRAGNQRGGEVEIGAEFVRRARLARIIAGG